MLCNNKLTAGANTPGISVSQGLHVLSLWRWQVLLLELCPLPMAEGLELDALGPLPSHSVILYLACNSAQAERVMSCWAAEALVVEAMADHGPGWDHRQGHRALGAPTQPERPSTSTALRGLPRVCPAGAGTEGGAAPQGLHSGLCSSSMQLPFPWLNFKHSYLCYFPSHTP